MRVRLPVRMAPGCGARGILSCVFTGLSAFPLTPFTGDGPDRGGKPDLVAYGRLVSRLAAAGVDAIGALGSTGGYAYLDRPDRRALAQVAVAAAGSTPVIVGVGAVTTRAVLGHVADAEAAGAAGVLLPPLGYQPLRPAEVRALVHRVSEATSLPIVIYDNPATTGFTFTHELLAELGTLPGVVSIKLPPVAEDLDRACADLTRLRGDISTPVGLGVSGDRAGVRGLLAGCDTWYSVLAGVFPRTCLEITRAAQAGDAELATGLAARLDPIWDLFDRFGSYRVVSAIAAEIGQVTPEGLHLPVLPLEGDERDAVRSALGAVGPCD